VGHGIVVKKLGKSGLIPHRLDVFWALLCSRRFCGDVGAMGMSFLFS
jgi:hypothetical protein